MTIADGISKQTTPCARRKSRIVFSTANMLHFEQHIHGAVFVPLLDENFRQLAVGLWCKSLLPVEPFEAQKMVRRGNSVVYQAAEFQVSTCRPTFSVISDPGN